MEVFGLEPYLGALVIAIIGISAATIFGWLGTTGAYDPRKVAASVLIGFPAAIIVVATELSVITIPEGDGGLTALIVIVGLIAQVAGFDTLIKTAKTIISKPAVKKPTNG
jgi:hypothetical protein